MEFNTADRILHFRNEFLKQGDASKAKWHFFYDETNNFRRLKIDKTEVESIDGSYTASADSLEKSFVIGGVAFATQEVEDAFRRDFSAQRFPTSLDKQTGKRETKCRQICIGKNIIEILNNTRVGRVSNFLELLDRNGAYIHVSTTNAFFYFIISEIVEKLTWILGRDDKGIDYSAFLPSLQDMLYDIVKDDKPWFMKTLKYWGYPSMDYAPDIKQFCDTINQHVTTSKDSILCGYPVKCDPLGWYQLGRLLRHVAIKCMLLRDVASDELRIGSNDEYVVDSLCDFYWSPCLVWYPSSNHVFDEEPTIEKKLESLFPEETITNFEMRNSVDDEMIQASDIWVGLYAKYEELLDGYITDTILPNYKIYPRHLSPESTAREIGARIIMERDQLEGLYRLNGDETAYHDALSRLQERFERELEESSRELSFPNTDEASQDAAKAILKQLNKTGRESIRLISKLILKSVDADEYTYRIEDSETTRRLRILNSRFFVSRLVVSLVLWRVGGVWAC